DRSQCTALPHLGDCLQAIGAWWHQEIEQNDVGIDVVQQEERRVTISRLGNIEPLGLQQSAEHAPNVGFVVHQQDLRPNRHWRLIRPTMLAPPHRVLASVMVPPCISMVCLTSASPSPVPSGFPVQYGSKMRSAM